MPSSLFELTNQLEVTSDPPQQIAGGSGARSITLIFPGLPSCCTEITINFEEDNGSDSKGTQSDEREMRLPTHELSTKTREEPAQFCQLKTCEGLVHEFDQSTVYIGLDSGLTAGRKKARKKTESLVRTLPILAHCSRRWLNFRGRKGHERGRICAFESGDVGKITSSSTSVMDGRDSPRQKLDPKQGFVSPLTFLNSMATLSTSTSHDRKKSLERSNDTRAGKYSSRKSKSGVGISETKPETLHGEEVEASNTKQKSEPLMNQLKLNNLPHDTRSKHNQQVVFDLSDSHEKVKNHDGDRYSETKIDRCTIPKSKDADLLPKDGPQPSSKPSCLSKSMPSQSSSKLVSKTTDHKVLDTMFIDVIKMLVAQEDPQKAKRSPSLGEQQEKHTRQADTCESTHQKANESRAFRNNKSRGSEQGSMWGNRKQPDNILGRSVSRNGLAGCDLSGLNFPLRTNSCDRNIDCGRNLYCDRNISCEKIQRSERNVSCERNMGYGKIHDGARNVSRDRSMNYGKNHDGARNVSRDRSMNYGKNHDGARSVSRDRSMNYGKNHDGAINVSRDRSMNYGKNHDGARNVSRDRCMSKNQDCARNVSCGSHMGYDKNQDRVRNITCERSKSFDKNISCDKHISSDGYITCDRNISCAEKLNRDKNSSWGRKIICRRNISCERKCRSQLQTPRSNSNNCHLCCWGEVNECMDFVAVLDSDSSSDDSLRGSIDSNEDLLSSEERKLGPQEGGARRSKMGRSLQGRLKNAANQKQQGGKSRNREHYGEKMAAHVLSGSPEVDHSSSKESLRDLQYDEQGRGASTWNDLEKDIPNSVAAKAVGNSESFQNAQNIFQPKNYCTGKDNDDLTGSQMSIHRGIDKAVCDTNNVDSTTCAHNCNSTSSCRQCNERRRITTEREDGNESQKCAAEQRSLAEENGAHKSVPKYAVVAVKSSKLHKFFAKSSENTRCAEERSPDWDLGYKNPGNVHLTSGNLGDGMSSTSVNLDSEDDESRLVEHKRLEEDCCSDDLQTAGSPNSKVTPLFRRFISLEKRKSRLSLASSVIGKAKTALFCVRSRSLSPATLGTKIKKMFFKESVDRILSKKPTAILNTGKDKRQRSGSSNQKKSSRQDVGSKQVVVSKDRVDLRHVTGSKKKADVSAIPKELYSPCCSTDVNGSIAKEYFKPQIKTTQTLELEEDKVEQAFSQREARTSRSEETEPVRSQSQNDSTSVRIDSATAGSDSASFDNRTTSEIDLGVYLRRKITQNLHGRFKMVAPQSLPTSAPFTVIIPPSLEVIAETESPSEESRADEETTQIKCEMFNGRGNITKVILSKGSTLECDNGLCAMSEKSAVRSKQTCSERKLVLRISSSYEDCTREFGDVSLGNNEIMPAPMRTHSLLSTFETAQTELQANNDKAIIFRKVQMKRYPSFSNLTDINDEDCYVSSVNTSGSNHCLVSKNTNGENPFLVQKIDEKILTNSFSLNSVSTSKTQPECRTSNSSEPSTQKADQSEFPRNLVTHGKINTEPFPSSHNFKLPSSETEINTACPQSWRDLENCEDAASSSSCLTTATKVNNATPQNSGSLLTHDTNGSEKYADLLSWKQQTDAAFDELVNLLPSPPNDSIEETVNVFECENVQLETVPTTSKLSDGVDNSIKRIQLLRAALYQADTLVNASVSNVKDLNNVAFQKECRHSFKENEQLCLSKLYNYLPYNGKQLLEEGKENAVTNVPNCLSREGKQLLQDKEQILLTKICNDFPCNPNLLNSQDCDPHPTNATNHISTDAANTLRPITTNQIFTNTTNEASTTNTTNKYVRNVTNQLATDTTNFLDTTNQLSMKTTIQLPANTTNQLPADTTNQLYTYTANQTFTNTTKFSKNATNEHPTNTTHQHSTDTTSQHSTQTTIQPHTNTINPDVQKHHQDQFDISTRSPHWKRDHDPTNDTKDPRLIHSALSDPDTCITSRENHQVIVHPSLNYTDYAHSTNSIHLQKQFLLDTNIVSFAESVVTRVANEGDISSVGREIITHGSFKKTDGVGNESSSVAEVEQGTTGRVEEVLDTCNSCLSDMAPEERSPENDKSSLDEQTSKNDSASSVTKTANTRKAVKTNNKKHAQIATNSKSIPIKSEAVLANTKKSKPSGLISTTDITKRDFKGKKERSKNINNTANDLFKVCDETIDVDLTSVRSSGRSNQFVVTTASSIFGAPDKKAASGFRSNNSSPKRGFVANQTLKPEAEETDDEDSDTLTNAELGQTRYSSIQEGNKVDSKRGLEASEKEIPKINLQTQTGPIFSTIRLDETDLSTQSFLSSLMPSALSCASLSRSSLDGTLCPDYMLGKTPQMNLGNSSLPNVVMPKPILIKTTSCFDCAFQKTPNTFPGQNILRRTMSNKLAHRTTWSSRTAPTKEDFTSRARYHLQRYDEVLQRSTGVIRRSQVMSVRVHRQMEHTAEKLKLLKWADNSCRPQ